MKKFLSLLLAVAVCFTAFVSTGLAAGENRVVDGVTVVDEEVQIPINGEYTLRAVGGDIEGLSYQWSYFEEDVAEFFPNPIEGATDNQLEIKKFSQYKAGYYYCEITCDGRRVGLSRFHVTVKPVEEDVPAWPDEIYDAENTVENFTPSLGETIRLEATKEKIEGITYQWYLEEGYVENNEDLTNPIQAETGNSLEITNVSKEDCGFYVCELNNGNEIRRYRAEVTLDTGLEVVGEPTDYPNISRMGEAQKYPEGLEGGNYTVIKILPEDLGKEIKLNSLAQNVDEELCPIEYQWTIYDLYDGEYEELRRRHLLLIRLNYLKN